MNAARPWLVPALILVVGAFVSAAGAWLLHQRTQAEAEAEFGRIVLRNTESISDRFRRPIYGLNGVRGVYATHAQVSRETFRRYVSTHDLAREFPGVRGFGIIQRVERADMAAFIAAQQADDTPQFALRQLELRDEPEHFVIKMIEPAANNGGAAGLDVGSERVRRAGVQQALETGKPATSGMVTLVQDDKREPGVLLYVPVYGNSAKSTASNATSAAAASTAGSPLRGLLFAPIVISELLAGLSDVAGDRVRLELFDTASGGASGPLLFDSNAGQAVRQTGDKALPRFEALQTVELPGRLVTLRARSTPAFEAAHRGTSAWLLGLGGLITSVLLAALLRQQITGRARAERHTGRMTSDLARLALVVRRTSNAVVITDAKRRITWVNEGFERISGYSAEEAIGRSPGALLQSDVTAPASVQAMREALNAGGGFHGELLNRAKNGSVYWIEIDIQPLHDDQGALTGFMAIETNITERKQAEAALRASQVLLSQTGSIGGVGGWELDVATQAVAWTDETCRIHDLPPGHKPTLEESLGYYAPQSRLLVSRAVAESMEYGQHWDLELELVTASGREIWVRAMGEAEFADGKPVRLIGAFQDITARRALEAELRAKNELVNSIIENLPCGVSVFDADLKLVASNHEFRRVLDFPDTLFAVPEVHFEDIIRFNALRGEYGNDLTMECIEGVVQTNVERARQPVQPHQFERVRPNGTPLEVRAAPMPGGGFVTTYIDVSARKAAEAEVQRSAALMRGAIDAIDEAFVLYDPDGVLVFCNDKYREMYPSMAHLMVPGAHFEDIIRAGAEAGEYRDALGRTEAWIEERLAAHRSGNTTLVQKLESGRTLRIVERKMPDGHIVGFRIDITELALATEAAEKASLAKSQFLANMSHEIRTPMNAILGMLTLLRRTELNTRQADYAVKTEGAARSLLGLLNDILDFSKVEAGKMTLDPHPFRVDQLMRDLGVVLSANAGAKPVEVLFDIDPQLPRTLVGDAMRLRQVLINLGGNAIKFTAEGEVVVSVHVVQRQADAVTLRVAVRDTGIGIAPENQARIFSGFTQAEASTTRRFGGTGLGVAISQRLVGLMGGELTLDSAVGQGSTFHFTVTLPVAEDAEGPAVAPPTSLKKLRALVVDDNPTARELLRDMAESLGWLAELAASGEEALKKLAACRNAGERYDVVFMDWQMPGLDGWETAGRIREGGLVEDVPVVVMVTAHGREKLAQRSSEQQAHLDDFLVKPVTASMLFDAVADARQRRALPTLSAPARQAAPGTPQRLAGLRLLVTEDNLNNQQVARELLEDEGAIVQLANNGLEGVEAVAAADPPFDVVLMDLQMPVMDGFTATARIRQDLARTHLPIVAMTANAMASDREACLAAGMNDHVGKPFDIDHLVAVLRRLSGRGAVSAVSAVSATGTEATADATGPAKALQAAAGAAGVDLAPALQRMGGKQAVYARMLRSALHDFDTLALALQQPLAAADWADTARSLHTLKGLSATLGMTALAAAAGHAEKLLAAGANTGLTAQEAMRACAEVGAPLSATLPALRILSEQLLEGVAAGTAAVVAVGPDDDRAALHQRLTELAALLGQSDMRATELTPALREQGNGRLGPRLAELDDAVSALDFERATPLCSELLLETQP